ncbi:MAG: beta-ketoacyl synthase N-terminal-like domain-containing protein [Kofleriaceae bacterium]
MGGPHDGIEGIEGAEGLEGIDSPTRAEAHVKAAMIAGAWRTSLGANVPDVIGRIRAGDRATLADARGYACTTIAPITIEPARSRNSRFLRRMGLFGLEAASEALAASGVRGGSRVGLFSGVGGLRAHWDDMIAAFADQREDGERMWERGLASVHPYWMLRHLSNNVHALASAELDLRGEGATFGGGNGGAQAMASATRALNAGAIDAALVVAYDSLLEPETLVELGARNWPAQGLVPGEAAAALVLVRVDAAGADATRVDAEGADAMRVDATRADDQRRTDTAARAYPPRVSVRDAAGRDALARCSAAIGDGDRDAYVVIAQALGQLGAATALVQAIALAELRVPVAIGLHSAAPELASAVRVEVSA